MSTLDRLPGVDSRCRYKTADGRRCTMLRMSDHPSLCYTHWRQQLVQTESYDHEGAAAELLGSIEDFNTATAVNQVLGRLLALLARNRIPPRNAAILAYICQLLLNSLPAVDKETMRAEGLPGWEQTITRAMQVQLRSSAVPDLAKAISQRALPANLVPSEQQNSQRGGETFARARNLIAQSRIPKKGGPSRG